MFLNFRRGLNGNFYPECEKFTQVDIMIMLKFEIRKTHHSTTTVAAPLTAATKEHFKPAAAGAAQNNDALIHFLDVSNILMPPTFKFYHRLTISSNCQLQDTELFYCALDPN